MSGHNKWSQIQRQKGAEDAKRSKLFSMLGRQISIQARLVSGDAGHPGLRAAIEKARKANMPSDTIDRAVGRGAGDGESGLAEVIYEAFGPGGVALIIEGITDSKNRTSNEIRKILADNNGSLGAPGAAAWAFTASLGGDRVRAYTPVSTITLSSVDEEKLAILLSTLEDHPDIKTVSTNLG